MADPLLPQPSDFDASSVDFALAQRRSASITALTSLDDSADDATRADELSRATGAKPALVYGDLENFEKQHKAALTSSILENNQYLRDYVASHPLAAKVSNDDWGQLDKISQVAQQLGLKSVLDKAAEGFKREFGSEIPGQTESTKDRGRLAWAIESSLHIPFEIAGRTFGGVLGAFHDAAVQLQTNWGVDPNRAEQRAREFTGLVEAELGGLSGRHAAVKPAQEAIDKAREALQSSRSYLERGVVPPVGIHPLIDQAHTEQAKLDAGNLDELFKEAQASATKERSPELFANFLRQHTNANIGISAEAVRKLYGDKIPKADDNLLGWVPQIQEQLALAEKHGGDVEIPLVDWVAKADPEVAKALHNDIRVRPEGMTLEETKGAKEGEEEGEVQPAVTPIDSLRQAAALSEPLLVKEGEEARGIIPQEVTQGEVQLGPKGEETAPAQTFSAQEALKAVDKDRLTGVPRALAEFFEDRLQKMAGDTPVWVVDPQTMARINTDLGHPAKTPGFYHPAWHAIMLAQDIADGTLGHDISAHVLIHEIAHAATHREIMEFPKLRDTISQMMAETDHFLNRSDPESRKVHDYAFKNESEFVAEAFSNPRFQNVLSSTPISNELAGRLGLHAKSSTVWDAVSRIVRNLVSKLLGKPIPPSIMDGIMKLGPVFEKAGKMIKEERGKTAPAEPIESRIRGLMPKKQLEKYLELIDKQQAEDLEFQKAQALKRSTETQTQEWKENSARVSGEVRKDIRNRPDLAADRLLREGILYDKKVGKVRLDSASLTEEQKAGLPKDYHAAGGERPDDLASAFGYQSGDALVGALTRVEQERQLEGLTPAAHLSKLVEAETERQMRRQYGTLDESIAKEAEDHVISPTQIDLLHEKMLALGMAAKTNEPLGSVANMKASVKELFNTSPVASHSVAKYLATAGRAGNRMRDAFLEDDIHGAFKAQQEQVYSMLLADEAKKLEKQQGQYDKLAKKLSQRAPTGIAPEYANYAQDILMRTGAFVRRSVQDLEHQRGLISEHKDLRSFVEFVNNRGDIWNADPDAMPIGQQMPVADFLLNPEYRKAQEEMMVEEWRAVFNSIKTIDKNGREVNKYNVKGKKEDLNEVRDGLIERLKAAVDNKKINTTPDQPTSVMRTIGSWILNPETWFNRLDLGNRRGPFNQLIMRPIVEGQYDLKTLERQHAKEWREIGEFGDLRKKIDNPLFKDTDGTLLDLNRGNLMSILSNMGNALQRRKLAGGYGITNPNDIWSFLQNSGITKEDVQRAQAMGKFFEGIFKRSERMYSELTGVVPERIELGTVQTPWGELEEWYHPLIPNPLKHAPLKAGDMMEESGYFKPATAAGYTKKRTGALYPIQLDFDAIPAKIKMMLNDIAMRPAITEVSKILLDRRFKDAFTQYYGKEYGKALEPWLRDAAGQRRYTPAADAALETTVNYLRENMSTLLIGFNLGTVMKHAPTALGFSMREVGPARFIDSMFHMLHETDEGKTRWRFAMDNSEELQNRLRSTRESISATNQDLFKSYSWDHKFFTVRDAIQTLGAIPVAMSDFMSAVPMWDAAYRKAMEVEGTSHGDAIYEANTAVRRTHGSSIITNRPAAMRMNSWVQTFMPFYNFFNNAAQRNYEFGWKAKLALQGRDLPEMTGFEKEQFEKGLKHIPEVLGGFLTFGVLVSLIEQAVDPLPPDPQHPIKQGAKIISRGPMSMVPGLRDLVNAAYGGHEPSAGLLGTLYQDVARPFTSGHIADPAKAIKMVNNAFGALTGLTYGAVGNVGQYVYNIVNGKEVPHDPLDLVRGYRHGTQREFKR